MDLRILLDTNKLNEIATGLGGSVTTDRESTVLTIKPEKIPEACRLVTTKMPNFYHLTTITGIDEGQQLALYYHFWSKNEFLSLKTSVPKENPTLATVTDILPASLLYEAELQDLLGINFVGNPLHGKRLLLPDSYPSEAPPPLRKEADPEKIRKMMNLE
jgi:Ni,Fe-hydrogenase III component G